MIPKLSFHGVILMIAVAALAVGCSSGPKATTAPACRDPGHHHPHPAGGAGAGRQ